MKRASFLLSQCLFGSGPFGDHQNVDFSTRIGRNAFIPEFIFRHPSKIQVHEKRHLCLFGHSEGSNNARKWNKSFHWNRDFSVLRQAGVSTSRGYFALQDGKTTHRCSDPVSSMRLSLAGLPQGLPLRSIKPDGGSGKNNIHPSALLWDIWISSRVCEKWKNDWNRKPFSTTIAHLLFFLLLWLTFDSWRTVKKRREEKIEVLLNHLIGLQFSPYHKIRHFTENKTLTTKQHMKKFRKISSVHAQLDDYDAFMHMLAGTDWIVEGSKYFFSKTGRELLFLSPVLNKHLKDNNNEKKCEDVGLLRAFDHTFQAYCVGVVIKMNLDLMSDLDTSLRFPKIYYLQHRRFWNRKEKETMFRPAEISRMRIQIAYLRSVSECQKGRIGYHLERFISEVEKLGTEVERHIKEQRVGTEVEDSLDAFLFILREAKHDAKMVLEKTEELRKMDEVGRVGLVFRELLRKMGVIMNVDEAILKK